jgi:hypothetical protein
VTLQFSVPVLTLDDPLPTTLATDQTRLYKVSVTGGETLRVTLDSSADKGANELYLRYGDIPTPSIFDAAYDNPLSPDQQVLIPKHPGR